MSLNGFETIFFGFFAVFIVIFVLVLGVFAVVIAKGIGQWSRNNSSPVVTAPATVIAKRTDQSMGTSDHHGSTSYFVTFQLQGGERMELQMSGPDYGLVVEHDRGQLTHQGTRYKAFTPALRDV